MKKEELLKEIEDVKGLMQNLEDDYRKANISEKDYEESKKKYQQKLEELERKLGKENPEKKGIISLLKKKEEPKAPAQEAKEVKQEELEIGEIEEMTPEVIEKLAQQVAATSGVTPSAAPVVEEEEKPVSRDIEIEKLKAMIDSFREMQRTAEESIRTLSESIGEIRSMVFQVDGSLRELAVKMEKMEDEIAGVKPKETEKRFREMGESMEKQQVVMEKLERKTEDLASKIGEIHAMLREAGGVENLAALSKDVKKQADDIKEALKYTERMAFKTEKIFLDLSKNLQEFAVFKTRMEVLDETVKDLLKTVDALGLKVENLPTKNDLDTLRTDLLAMQKEIEEMKKVLPLLDAKLPETIVSLRKERESILLFLESLEEQFKTKAISRSDYEDAKKKSMAKLASIEKSLREEWKTLEAMVSKGSAPEVTEEAVVAPEKTSEEKRAEEEVPEKEETIEKKEVKRPRKAKPKKVEETAETKVEEKKPPVEPQQPPVEPEATEEKPKEDKSSREEMVNILKKIKEKVG